MYKETFIYAGAATRLHGTGVANSDSTALELRLYGPGAGSNPGEIPHVQGKRNPSKTVGAETAHQRADRLKPQSKKTNQSNHVDHSLV